jgi:hypothetical protein
VRLLHRIFRRAGHFAIAASKIKMTETMMPNIEPFAKDRNKPTMPIRIRRIRKGENWDFFLIGAPHLGHVGAVVETAF